MRTGTLVAVVLAAGLGCSDGGGPSDDDNGTPTGDVVVGNNFFNPSSLQVTAGDEVVWAWSASAAIHNVTFDAGPPNSPDQSSGTFARTFGATGTYPYHCTIHGQAMSGTIVVVAAGTGGSGAYASGSR